MFAITWGLAAALFLAPGLVSGPEGTAGGRGRVAYYVAVCAPTVVGLTLTLRRYGWRAGWAVVARGMVAPGPWWRTAGWLVLGAVVIPLGWVLAWALSHVGGGAGERLDLVTLAVTTPLTLLTTTVLLTDPGPLGEEFGWRGFALPRLRVLLNPTAAGLTVGALMALWHVPSFYAAQLVQSDLAALPMITNWLGWGVVAAWVHERSGGNWVAAGLLPHAVVNCAAGTLGAVDVGLIYGTGSVLAAFVLLALAPRRGLAP